MFLLTRDRATCQRAILKLRSALGEEMGCGPAAMCPVGESWMGWFRARLSDNLHVFSDAFIVGKLVPGEPATGDPLIHASEAPASVHPLSRATRVTSSGRAIRVQPCNATNVFYDRDSVSDMQLLIADAKGYRPTPEGAALLAAVGYCPGNLSLFSQISRIPLFHALDIESGRLVRVGRFESKPADGEALISRLVSLIPVGVPSMLAISGGCDSRFVLGILMRAGVRPALVRLSNEEDPTVRRLAEELDLSLDVIRAFAPHPTPERYVVMTDAQIYYRGGQYGRIRRQIPRQGIYYTGLYANSVLKNALRAAWKVPRVQRDMTARLVEHGLLGRMRPTEHGLRVGSAKATLVRTLRDRIAIDPADGPFEDAKELASWFAYVQRATRWIPAHLGDLSFFAEPVAPLSDLGALEVSIRSSSWSNFGNDRVRLLTERLLPLLSVGYSSGQPRLPRRGLRGIVDKLMYEYGSRAIIYLQGREPNRSGRSPHVPQAVAAQEESAQFREYFDRPLSEIAAGGECSRSVSRAAVTMNSTLLYLESRSEAVQRLDATDHSGVQCGS